MSHHLCITSWLQEKELINYILITVLQPGATADFLGLPVKTSCRVYFSANSPTSNFTSKKGAGVGRWSQIYNLDFQTVPEALRQQRNNLPDTKSPTFVLLITLLNGVTLARSMHLLDEQQSRVCELCPWKNCQIFYANAQQLTLLLLLTFF